ncbi:MAG: thiol reductant ABC exporter subunit CydC [Lysobacteraceae bacterium]
MSPLQFLWQRTAGQRGWMLLGLLLALLTSLANIALLALSGWFISAMALAGVAGVSMNYFTPAALIRLSAIVRTAGRYGERLSTHEATFRVLATMRVWLYERIEPLAPQHLEQYQSGDLLNRLRADIDSLNHLYLRVWVPSLVALLSSLICVLVVLLFDWRMALWLGWMLGTAGWILPKLASRAGQPSALAQQQTLNALRMQWVGDLRGLAEMQLFGAQAMQSERIESLAANLLRAQRQQARWAGTLQAAFSLIVGVCVLGMLWLAIPAVQAQRIAPPELAMLALLAMASFESLTPLPVAFQSLGESREAMARVLNLVNAEPEVRDPAHPQTLPDGHALQLSDVSFRYADSQPWVLRQLDWQVPSGARIALIGPNGAGKSSVMALLTRLRAPQHGVIRLDGINLADLSGEQVRSRFAVLSQHAHLFNTTLRSNLRLAAPDADDSRLRQACRAAGIEDFVDSLPAGLETPVGELGSALSGGQARRIALARTLLKPAPILILDEPTEGMDAVTAEQVMRGIHAWVSAQTQTLIVITHRPLETRDMDAIYRLTEGRLERVPMPFGQGSADHSDD